MGVGLVVELRGRKLQVVAHKTVWYLCIFGDFVCCVRDEAGLSKYDSLSERELVNFQNCKFFGGEA